MIISHNWIDYCTEQAPRVDEFAERDRMVENFAAFTRSSFGNHRRIQGKLVSRPFHLNAHLTEVQEAVQRETLN